jgi:hypothetical protein
MSELGVWIDSFKGQDRVKAKISLLPWFGLSGKLEMRHVLRML